MAIYVREMNAQGFESFQEDSERIYMSQLVATGYSKESAKKKAQSEGQKILPDGVKTKDAVFLTILKDSDKIGYFWFGTRDQRGVKTAFTYAFEIYSHAKGHGFSAMVKAREYLRELGIKKVTLHVFSENDRAVELYKAVGFRVDSYYMSFEL